jgi:hypothetical protein
MRVRVALLAVLAAFMAASTYAQAAPLTMGQLLVRCKQLDVTKENEVRLRSAAVGDALDAGKCFGHLEAYLDLATIEVHDPNYKNVIHPLGACPPASEQLYFTKIIAMFLDNARNHPELQQEPAAIFVADMLARRYPCRRPSR